MLTQNNNQITSDGNSTLTNPLSVIAVIDYSNTYVNGTQTNGQVYIRLINAATGSTVNGNGVTVTYQIINNGASTTLSSNIAGQSIPIDTGLIGDTNPAHPVAKSYAILSLGTVPAAPPVYLPVDNSDLAINFINVDRPESAPGARDGQITVNASSSLGPLAYSLNGTTYQPSPVFNGLPGGLLTVYVQDAGNFILQKSALVNTLTNLLVSDPSLTLADGSISRWSAVFNPVVFTYQRKDFGITGAVQDSITGYAVLQVNTSLINPFTGGYAVYAGSKVYVSSKLYEGVYTVVQANGTNSLMIQVPFTGDAQGFININNLRPYYNIRTRITYTDKLSGTAGIVIATNRPDAAGIVKADLSSFLQSILRVRDESDYLQASFRDDNLSACYQVEFSEQWDNLPGDTDTAGHTSPWIALNHNYFALYAARQLGDRYGGNLAAYVTFPSVLLPADRARWVTDFAEPAYSCGYPFDIGFIYGDALTGKDLFAEFTLLDINRIPLPSGPQTTYLLNDDGSRLLNNDGSKLIISRQSTSAIPVPAQMGLNRLLINDTYTSDVSYINLTLKYTDERGTHTLTQTQTIRIDDAVDDRSVYLRWIGLCGSWNYYRFVYNQEVSLDVQNAVIIKNYVSNWANQDGIEEVISKTAGQKIKVMAEDLPVADIMGLQSIKYSPKVQMLVNKNPVKWQTVIINTATYSEYETRNGQAPFSLTFNLPGINIQTQ